MKVFEKAIIRAGVFNDNAGKPHTFTKGDLAALVENYNAAAADEANLAPAVIGHPETNAPAYGWVKQLKMVGDTVVALIAPTVKEFADAVRNKIYPKVSVSVFRAAATSNPTPGQLTLRHVGFLGGAAPAVPGLPLASFGDDNAAVPVFEFADGEMELGEEFAKARAMELARQQVWLDEKAARLMLREQELEARERANASTGDKKGANNMNKNELPAALAEQQAKLDARERAVAEQEAKFAEQEKAQKREAIKAKVDAWKNDGKLPPAFAEQAEKVLAGLDTPAADFVAENDGKSVGDVFCEMMDGLQKSGLFANLPRDGKTSKPALSAAERGAIISAAAQKLPEGMSFSERFNAAERQLIAEGVINDNETEE